jgi:adenosylmethionine-8-amino-7-oxononanoate aminotransferase
MGAVLLSEGVYRAMADGTPDGQTIGHGLTYSGHPVSAAVGLEVMRLYTEEGIVANGAEVGERFERRLREVIDHPLVGDIRSRGLLAGVELVTSKTLKTKPDPALGLPAMLSRIGYENGLIFRAFNDGVVGFAPPLSCTDDEIDMIIERFKATLDGALNHKEIRDALD